MTPAGFRKLPARLAVAAKFPFPVHPHVLRHATGYKLASDGRDTRSLRKRGSATAVGCVCARWGGRVKHTVLTTALKDGNVQPRRGDQHGSAVKQHAIMTPDRRRMLTPRSREVASH